MLNFSTDSHACGVAYSVLGSQTKVEQRENSMQISSVRQLTNEAQVGVQTLANKNQIDVICGQKDNGPEPRARGQICQAQGNLADRPDG